MSVTTMKSFVKQFIATVKGDDAAATAEKAFRQAESALKTQISSLEGDTISLEENVLEAKETQSSARVNNGNLIGSRAEDRTAYVTNLLHYKNNVTKAEDALKLHLAKIEFLKEELKALEKEVSAE